MRRILNYLLIFALIFFAADAVDDTRNPLHQYVPASVVRQLGPQQEAGSSSSSSSSAGTPGMASQQANQTQQSNSNDATPLEGYKWPNRNVTVAITSTDPRTKQAFNDAINAWNKTGAINFQLTDHDQDADIVADDKDLSADDQDYGAAISEELGQTNTEYDPSNKILSHAESSLDINKLANSSREYRMWVAEHELGHAIGLDHADQHANSVMIPANPRAGITSMDVNAVHEMYG